VKGKFSLFEVYEQFASPSALEERFVFAYLGLADSSLVRLAVVRKPSTSPQEKKKTSGVSTNVRSSHSVSPRTPTSGSGWLAVSFRSKGAWRNTVRSLPLFSSYFLQPHLDFRLAQSYAFHYAIEASQWV
jgi:hypothetical protein